MKSHSLLFISVKNTSYYREGRVSYHQDHRCAGGNKIVEHDYVVFGRRFFAKGKDRPDTVLRVALGNILIEWYAEKLRERAKMNDA